MLCLGLLGPGASGARQVSGFWPEVVDAAPQGGVVTAGHLGEGVAVLRYLPGGSLDTSYGHAGGVRRLGPFEYVSGIRTLSGGKTLVLGGRTGFSHVLLARLTATGRFDRDFSGDGVATVYVPGSHGGAGVGPVVDRAGRILVGGDIGACANAYGCKQTAVVVRMTAAGERDESFGVGGAARLDGQFGDPNPVYRFEDLALSSRGQVLLSGTRIFPSQGGVVVRLGADGSVDPSFGAGEGYVSTALPASNVAPHGPGAIYGGAIADSLYVARLGADGVPDSEFGNDGVAGIPLATARTEDWDDGLVTRQSGSIVAGAELPICRRSETACRPTVKLIRLTGAGRLVRGFGSGGVATRPVPGGPINRALVGRFDLADGAQRLLAVANGSRLAAIFRLRLNGRPDLGFGRGGMISIARR